MKIFTFILAISLTLCIVDKEKHEKMVNFINKLRTTWTAKLYERDIVPLVGSWAEKDIKLPRKTEFQTSNADLPKNFDSREAHPECETIREVRDQSRCGACWAFAAAEVMSDRLCIHSNGELQTRVSAQHILTCCTQCGNGCFGGYPSLPFEYWKSSGVPSGGLYGDTNSCKPYFLPPCNDHMHECSDYVDTPKCVNSCQEGYPKTINEDKTYGVSSYYIYGGEEFIMKEIYEKGPISGAFTVYEDFADYAGGVYQHVTGEYLGGHAIKIIGWGETDDGVKYWLVANSWNESWGENGFFKILRGVNECGIEDNVYAAMPKL